MFRLLAVSPRRWKASRSLFGEFRKIPPHTRRASIESSKPAACPSCSTRKEQDYAVSNAYGITNVPTSFLIEQDGTISVSSVGWDKKEVELVSKYLGEAASVPELTPFNPGESVLDFRGG